MAVPPTSPFKKSDLRQADESPHDHIYRVLSEHPTPFSDSFQSPDPRTTVCGAVLEHITSSPLQLLLKSDLLRTWLRGNPSWGEPVNLKDALDNISIPFKKDISNYINTMAAL